MKPVAVEERPEESVVLWDAGPGMRRFAAAGVFGLLFIVAGLAVDALLHALDPDLAAEEGLFTLRNPGHLLMTAGIGLAAGGLLGVAATLIRRELGAARLLRVGRGALVVGLVGLVASFTYIGLGPGFGHGHDDIAPALEMSDGSRLSSSLAASVDRSRLPADEAAALAALAWSRAGSLEEAGASHDHGDDGEASTALSAAENRAVEAQLALTAATVARYPTPAEAEADGYVQASPSVNGVGAHWVKWSLVDRPFDAAAPSMLLFEEIKWGEGPALVGFSYWVASEDEPEGFAGASDVWHQHYGLCFENGWMTMEDIADRSACPGDWVHGGDLWMLHAWVVPGMESRHGVFSALNPRLCERSC
jgi:hypothetical protein